MRGEDVREVFEAVLPEAALTDLIEGHGMEQRARKRDSVRLVRAGVIASARGGAGRQASILDSYFHSGGEPVVRGAAYSWFSEAFEKTMKSVADRAMSHALSQPVDLPGWLGKHVRDWYAFDSTTVRLDDDLIEDFPGAGEYAALKVHKRFSIGVGATVGYSISPAREHDCRHLTLDESWRGCGLLADLGYASFKLLRDAQRLDVRYVIRLKESWKPKVDVIAAGDVSRTFLPGADFDALLDDEVLRLTGPSIDADVRLGRADGGVPSRLVGVQHDGPYRYYLTNLPRDVSPQRVAQLYRVRWEIELDNRLNKSGFNMDEIFSRTAHTARALVHASIAASVLACLLAHKHRLEQRWPRRSKAPAHESSRPCAYARAHHGGRRRGHRSCPDPRWRGGSAAMGSHRCDPHPHWRRPQLAPPAIRPRRTTRLGRATREIAWRRAKETADR